MAALLGFLTPNVAVAQTATPAPYIEVTSSSGVAAAARIANESKGRVLRVSFTDRARHTSVTTLHPDLASVTGFAPQNSAPRGLALFTVEGERQPVLLVTVLDEERETYPDEYLLSARSGRLATIPTVGMQDDAPARDDRQIARLSRAQFLYEYDQYGTAGGAGAWYNERRRRYAAHRLDTGALVVIDTAFTINDFDHEQKATPPAIGLPSCVALFSSTDQVQPYAAACP